MNKNKRKYLIDCDIKTKSNQELEFYLIKTDPDEKVVVCTDNDNLYSVTVDISDENVPLFIMEIKNLFHSWKNKNYNKEKKILSDLNLLGDNLCIRKIKKSVEIETVNLFDEAKTKNNLNLEYSIKQKRTHLVLLCIIAIMSASVLSFVIWGS